MISPIQFIVQVNSQVLVKCHHLDVSSQDVNMCAGLSVPTEIHHQLFGLSGVELEVILMAPVHKVLNKFSEGSVVPVPDEAEDSRVIRELLYIAMRGLVVEVCGVQGKQERGQDCSLWGSRTADYCVRHVVPSPHILWPVSEVIQDPGCEVLVHPHELQLVPQECRQYSVKSTG